MELQTVTLRYKRGPRQGCICHDDVYAVSSLENDPMKHLAASRQVSRKPLNEERGK
jgi:hypothetical protein